MKLEDCRSKGVCYGVPKVAISKSSNDINILKRSTNKRTFLWWREVPMSSDREGPRVRRSSGLLSAVVYSESQRHSARVSQPRP